MYLYLHNIPETDDWLAVLHQVLYNVCGRNIILDSAKRVGKRNKETRPILISVNSLEDKFVTLLNCEENAGNITIKNFDLNLEDMIYEKVQSKFLKFVLNVNKYASNLAVRGETGRFPMSIKAISLGIKYWHNMSINKSPNILLMHAFMSDISIKADWLQGIQYILQTNGMSCHWLNPTCVTSSHLYKAIKKRLEDQYIQHWFGRVNKSSFLCTLNSLKNYYSCSKYLKVVESHNIRSILTKLRINNSKLKQDENCNNCDGNPPNTVEHLLLLCSKTTHLRTQLVGQLDRHTPYISFSKLPTREKMRLLLDLSTQWDHDTAIIIDPIVKYIKASYNTIN